MGGGGPLKRTRPLVGRFLDAEPVEEDELEGRRLRAPVGFRLEGFEACLGAPVGEARSWKVGGRRPSSARGESSSRSYSLGSLRREEYRPEL